MLRTFLNRLVTRSGERSVEIDVDRDCTMQVFLNDTVCELIVRDRAATEVAHHERRASDNILDARDILGATVEALSPDVERRIGNVEIFLDDEEISIVDSRQAKLSHFEGRALAEFGKYQLGGKPVCFASHKFGETSAQETEKRIVAYISEDRLTAVLFAMGKLSRFTTFFGPWSLQALFAESQDEARAQLSVHGQFSTLTLANGAAGALAVRNLPVGTRTLSKAYGAAHGIADGEAENALASRQRLPSGRKWPLAPGDPGAHTGTHQALAPVLEQLSGEIAATTDYFEFQRLAGRATQLMLSNCGAKIAGLTDWLADMLQLDVGTPAAAPGDRAPALNLLEGMRSGLLKIGSQHFDFVGGRFVPSKTSLPENAGSSGTGSTLAKWKSASSQPVTAATLKPMLGPALVAAALLAAVWLGYGYLAAPAGMGSDAAVNLYAASLARLDTARAPAAQSRSEPVLWAKDLIAVSAAMPYDMKLKRIVLTAASPTVTPSVEITGLLPRGGEDNLQLIGRYITRFNTASALKRRFGQVDFAGAGSGDTADSTETSFRIVARLAGATAP